VSRSSTGEALGAALGSLIVYGAISFGVDSFFAQMVLFVMGSFHIIAGFWQAFLLVIVLSGIIGTAAVGGVKAAG
jgi:hypothetical protein